MRLLCRVGRGVRLAERNEVELVAFCTYTTEYICQLDITKICC